MYILLRVHYILTLLSPFALQRQPFHDFWSLPFITYASFSSSHVYLTTCPLYLNLALPICSAASTIPHFWFLHAFYDSAQLFFISAYYVLILSQTLLSHFLCMQCPPFPNFWTLSFITSCSSSYLHLITCPIHLSLSSTFLQYQSTTSYVSDYFFLTSLLTSCLLYLSPAFPFSFLHW